MPPVVVARTERRTAAGVGFAKIAALIAAITLAAAAPAVADAIKIELLTKVSAGQRPKVRLVATEPIERVTVDLNRADGKVFSSASGRLAPGAAHEIVLPADAGRQRYEGRVVVTARGGTHESRIAFDAIVAPILQVQIDKSKVDVRARTLEARLSRPAGKVAVRVLSAVSATPIAEAEHDFTGRAAGEPLTINWPEPAAGSGEVARIELTLHDADGFYTGVALHPWSVHIPHEEVSFATDSATITAAETPKLAASLKLIADALAKNRNLGAIKLYVAGHTDTQGAAAYNVKLSQRRAQAIAAWFRKHGLRIPVAYEGFGEHAPAVTTADETDEPKNRRVDYILAVEDPVLKATSFRAAWKRLP